jgi:hypothetical protein
MAKVKVRRRGKLNQTRGRAAIGAQKGLVLSGKLVALRAQRKARRKTGRLKRSLQEGKPYQNQRYLWRIDIGTKVVYAAAHEFGSGQYAEGGGQPYKIRARRKKALSFEWEDAPAEVQAMFPETFPRVFFVSVTHPGIRAQPYLRPALRESEREIRRIIINSVVAEIRGGR